ncbi:MAG: ABC transporter ATP-binding protein [Thermomicrobiales bacterium]
MGAIEHRVTRGEQGLNQQVAREPDPKTPTGAVEAVGLLNVSKRFGPVVANRDVTFTANWGEVHALVGENGAGKSTLMSILAGMYRPDSGMVRINDMEVSFKSPRDAIACGIGMVYQHFMLVESFTVAENVLLGEASIGVRLDLHGIEHELAQLSKDYGLGVDPRARIWQLSVGEQQRVEIIRSLHRGARILVLDEPTAVLTPAESEHLIATLRGMAAEGFCIIFISHKLDEVLAVADRISVLRRGEVTGTVASGDTTRRDLARMMVGRELATALLADEEVEARRTGDAMLVLSGLQALGDKALPALNGVSFQIHAGETLGIAGVAGNGQRELAEVIAGMRAATGGQVTVQGKDLTNHHPREVARAGVAHVPEDRLGTGLVGSLDVSTNAIVRSYRRSPISRGPLLVPGAIARFTDRLVENHDVKTPGRSTSVRDLSGGNQQKLLIARELAGEPNVIVAVHPTRGVDVGAAETIHDVLRAQRERGAAILLISEDLDELLALSDRIAVMYEGKIMGIVSARGADLDVLGEMMAGMTLDDTLPDGDIRTAAS